MKPPETQSLTLGGKPLAARRAGERAGEMIRLPAPTLSRLRLEEALKKRRSVRDYSREALRIGDVSSLLWAAQGVTSAGGLRTAPSAGAIYPVKSYLAAFRVEGLAAGFYLFDPDAHALRLLAKGDKQRRIAKACGEQQCVEQCAAGLLLTAWYSRLKREYGETAERLAMIEAGHIGQNWHLQAAALGLGSVSVGKLDAVALKMLLPVPEDEEPVYFLAAGRAPAQGQGA